MARLALGLLALIAAAGASAQAPPAPVIPHPAVRPSSPRPSSPTSAYCLAASAAFLESESKATEELRKCARGDTIVIPAKSASAIARLCDFSKSIVTTSDHVVCVLQLPERDSKQ